MYICEYSPILLGLLIQQIFGKIYSQIIGDYYL